MVLDFSLSQVSVQMKSNSDYQPILASADLEREKDHRDPSILEDEQVTMISS